MDAYTVIGEGERVVQKTDIEWCDVTWNPVTGCLNNCEYCYARKIAQRFGGCDVPSTYGMYHQATWERVNPGVEKEKAMFVVEEQCPPIIIRFNAKRQQQVIMKAPFPFGFQPTLREDRLREPQEVKKPQNIFVCSMSDLFGSWVPTEWIVKVFDACGKAPQHRYLFLTKFPQRYIDLHNEGVLPSGDNFMFGSTVTHPDTDKMFYAENYHTFVSIEPLLEPFVVPRNNPLQYMDWVIVGAETGNRKEKVTPAADWLSGIIHCCNEMRVPLLMKDSLIPVMGEEHMRREFPWDV